MFSPRAREMSVRITGSTYVWGIPTKEGKDLRSAARFGRVQQLRYLLEAARQPTSPISLLDMMGERDNIGCTALCIAVLNGRLGVVRVLLAAGADKNVESEAGLTPLDVAFMKGHDTVASLLRDSGARRSLSSESSAYVRVRLGPRMASVHDGSKAEVDELRPPHAMPTICRFWSSQADRGPSILRKSSAEESRGVAEVDRGPTILRAASAEASRGVAEVDRAPTVLRAASAEASRGVAEPLWPHHEVPKIFQFWSEQIGRRASC
ncbi:hypothetical protein T484DRAFT_1986781 [Baffinella frigidus]|nr:hypothetical protein T484DRAFT_1986781 [Cryptophyta sp. CCMP2293]